MLNLFVFLIGVALAAGLYISITYHQGDFICIDELLEQNRIAYISGWVVLVAFTAAWVALLVHLVMGFFGW